LSALLSWLAAHESALSAIAALIAISAGVAVVTRLIWTRMPSHVTSQVKRPAFLSDWRNIGLIGLAGVALILALILGLGNGDSDANSALADLSGKPSVAVLPLNNISDDPEQTYLADGIAEDVITLLSSNPRFFVVARNSSFTYKGKAVDIRQVGEELGVRYVVEGSLRKVGDRLRVNMQLIDTSNGLHLWAEKYDRAYTDLFALQDEITNGIATALGDQIFTAEIARAHSKPTDNLDAWGLVMRSNRSFVHFNRESSNQAIEDLRAALVLDPNYALAKAELTINLCLRVAGTYSDNPREDLGKAYALGAEALREAPEHPLVLTRVGSCYGVTGRRDDGIRLLEKALVKQANSAMALWGIGAALAMNGQAALALAKLEQAIELSPRAPEMYIIKTFQTIALVGLERYEEAQQAALAGLRSYDRWDGLWRMLAIARAGLGDIKGAQEALYKAKEIEPGFSLKSTKASYAIIYKDQGRHILSKIEPIWPEDLLTTDEN
jgi:TolB-like protein/Tfp pilus assembly protein PilF